MTADDFTRGEILTVEGWSGETIAVFRLPDGWRVDTDETGVTVRGATHLTAQEPTYAEAVAYLAAFVEDLPPGEGDAWTPDNIARVRRGLRAARDVRGA